MIFTQNELIISIGVVSLLLLCLIVLTIMDLREYLKEKKGLIVEDDDMDVKERYEEVEDKPDPVHVVLKEDNEPDEIMVSTVKSNSDDILLEEMEDEKFDVNVKVNPVIEEVQEETSLPKVEIKEEVELPKLEINEEVELPKVELHREFIEPTLEKKEKKKLELFEELDELEEKLPNKLDDVTNFEMEQERTAIISLDELLKKSDELYNDNEFIQYDDGNEPITIDEVIARFRKESEPVTKEIKEDVSELPLVMEEIDKVEPALYNRKETVPFISSVYGIEKENNALEFENTATYEKLDRENYNDFMAKLREMNENK